jgi:SAM-dependent methyltransferase
MDSLQTITSQIDVSLRSDKDERYLAFYEELFSGMRSKPLNMLEVGVFNGGSLLLFAKYFEQARLLGVDINTPPGEFFDQLTAMGLQNQVSLEKGSQDNRAFLKQSLDKHFGTSPLDIVIDDASHYYKQTRATFDYIFHERLKSGGYYIIEDWGCGYWPKWHDGNPNGKYGLPRLVKELVDLVALRDRTRLFLGRRAMRVQEEQESPIARMIVAPAIVALIKA